MVKGLIFVLVMTLSFTALPQETVMDDLVQQEELNTEDDALQLQAELLRKHPLNLNIADATELSQLPFLNGLHVQQFLLYRQLMGSLLHIYELQAVPGWSPDLIRSLLPFITVDENWLQRARREKWLSDGAHTLLIRYSAKADATPGTDHPPSNYKMLLRYRYAYRDRLQYGVVADKDAGEPFFGPVQRGGFDFYSFHFFIRKKGRLHLLAFGDFTANMGQGLIHWQRMAFGKGAETASAKRQAPVINPYQSAGEFQFHRGAAVGLNKGRWQAYLFLSGRRLSATIERDSAGKKLSFSTIRTSGLHQTAGEQAGKNQLRQWAAGIVIRYAIPGLQLSFNSVYHRFSIPMIKQNRPENFFAINGRHWWNGSVDYGYTWRNLHLFGELARDREGAFASLQGVLLSLSSQFDLAIIRRDLAVAYQSVAGQAFTESTSPGNERGTFFSLDWRPFPSLRVQAFADQYFFPWIRSSHDRPHRGGDFQFQVTHKLSKRSEYSIRWRQSWSQSEKTEGVNGSFSGVSRNFRFHQQVGMSGKLEWRQRAEFRQVSNPGQPLLHGWLYYTELLFNPLLRPWNVGVRAQYFDTDGYVARVYAFERDVLYFSSLSTFYDTGYRVYLLVKYEPLNGVGVWLKWATTWKRDATREPVAANSSTKQVISEIRLQILVEI